MSQLIAWVTGNRVAANLLALILVAGGVAGLSVTTVRLFPEIDTNAISVTVPYPGANPREVEDSIVEPIEQQLEGLEGVRKVTSIAAQNTGNVIVDLRSGTDLSEKLDDVQREIDQITVFPEDAEEPRVVDVERDELIVQLVLWGATRPATLKGLALRSKEQLTASEAMSDVRVTGVPDYLIDVAVSRDSLRAYGLSLEQVARVVGENSLELSGGEIEDADQRTLVRTIGESKRGDEFSELVVTTGENGAQVRLADLGAVDDALSENPVGAEYDGQAAIVLSIFRSGEEEVFEIVEAVEAHLQDELKPALPAGVHAQIWRDDSRNLRSRIELLLRNAAFGLLLIGLLLLLFLDLRTASWVAFGVALSFVAAFIPISLFGYAINQLSLFGFILAIGIVVDDAIVVGENIYATQQNGGDPLDRAVEGTQRVARPVIFAVLTTIAAFSGLLAIPGTYGEFIGPIAAVVIFVLVFSMVESFFILPRHLAHPPDDEPKRGSPRWISDWLRSRVGGALERFQEQRFRPVVRAVVAHPVTTCCIATAVFIGALGFLAGGFVKFVFFPEIEGNYVNAEVELAEGASEEQTRAALAHLADAAHEAAQSVAKDAPADADEVVQGVLTSLGEGLAQNEPATSVSAGAAANAGYITVKIRDAATRAFTAKAFENAWREAAGSVPGAQKLAFKSSLVNAGAPVSLQVSAQHEEDARAAVAELRSVLQEKAGVFDIRDDRFRTTDEVRVALRPEARSYGVSLRDVASAVRASYFGAEAVRIQRDDEEIDVRVRLPRSERSSLGELYRRRIHADGDFIPISTVASLSRAPAPATIRRVDGRRVITLTADVDTAVTTGGAVTSAILEQEVPRLKKKTPSLDVGVGGEREEQARAAPSLARNFGLALLAIYVLLALAFQSYTQPLVIMLAVPFGFVGALLGHAALGLDLTLLSLFGIIGLSGVVINDGLLMVDFINERLGKGDEVDSAVIDSAVRRFRPILLTSLTTFLGVTPIILEQSVQAQFLVPTAVSLGFGILFATFVLSLVVPAVATLHARWIGVAHG